MRIAAFKVGTCQAWVEQESDRPFAWNCSFDELTGDCFGFIVHNGFFSVDCCTFNRIIRALAVTVIVGKKFGCSRQISDARTSAAGKRHRIQAAADLIKIFSGSRNGYFAVDTERFGSDGGGYDDSLATAANRRQFGFFISDNRLGVKAQPVREQDDDTASGVEVCTGSVHFDRSDIFFRAFFCQCSLNIVVIAGYIHERVIAGGFIDSVFTGCIHHLAIRSGEDHLVYAAGIDGIFAVGSNQCTGLGIWRRITVKISS